MGKRNQFKTLRDYVDSFRGTVTQGHVARVLGLTDAELSKFLHGHRLPSKREALRLSREHGISLEGLLDPRFGERRAS